MPLVSSVQNHLQIPGALYHEFTCPACDNLYQTAQTFAVHDGKVLRSTLLDSNAGPLMAIVPCDRILDVAVLSARLGCDVWPASK